MAIGCFVNFFGAERFQVDHVSGPDWDQEITEPTHWRPLPDPPK